ncbi:hypothetical protein ACEQ8H_007354 [Pleosporales sp. CAS-2024a]
MAGPTGTKRGRKPGSKDQTKRVPKGFLQSLDPIEWRAHKRQQREARKQIAAQLPTPPSSGESPEPPRPMEWAPEQAALDLTQAEQYPRPMEGCSREIPIDLTASDEGDPQPEERAPALDVGSEANPGPEANPNPVVAWHTPYGIFAPAAEGYNLPPQGIPAIPVYHHSRNWDDDMSWFENPPAPPLMPGGWTYPQVTPDYAPQHWGVDGLSALPPPVW